MDNVTCFSQEGFPKLWCWNVITKLLSPPGITCVLSKAAEDISGPSQGSLPRKSCLWQRWDPKVFLSGIIYYYHGKFWSKNIIFQNELILYVHCSPRAPEGKHTRKKLQLWHSTTEDLRRWGRHKSTLKHYCRICANKFIQGNSVHVPRSDGCSHIPRTHKLSGLLERFIDILLIQIIRNLWQA